MRRGLALAPPAGDHLGQEGSFLWNVAGALACSRGELVRASEWFQRSMDFVQEGGHWGFGATTRLGMGWVALERGDLAEAAGLSREARRLARAGGAHDVQMLAPLTLARARLRGRTASRSWRWLMALVPQACALATRHVFPRGSIDAALLRAEAHKAQGEPAVARLAAEEALGTAREQQRRREEALARYLLGTCALDEGQVAEGEAHLRAALALQREAGVWLDAAHTCVAVAGLLGEGSMEGRAPRGRR